MAMDHAAENVDPTKGENVVRIDLQDIYRANPKAFIAASAVIAAAFAFLVIEGISSSGSSSPSAKPAAAHGTTTSPGGGNDDGDGWGDDSRPELPPGVRHERSEFADRREARECDGPVGLGDGRA